jgi:hypothetical protein
MITRTRKAKSDYDLLRSKQSTTRTLLALEHAMQSYRSALLDWMGVMARTENLKPHTRLAIRYTVETIRACKLWPTK